MIDIKAVDIKGLTKFYGKSIGVYNLNFSIDQGEVFGYIGPNGAGKSTTIRTLLNFIFPSRGSATIFGNDIVKQAKYIRQFVGYLPSEIHYYDDLKVRQLLKYSASFYKKDCSKRISELSESFGLDLNKKIEDLSLGNRKKVAIVQALIHEPKLLILDEPTSGLDPLMQKVFFEVLNQEKQKGVTIFFSSHVLTEVQKVCDRVGIIKGGELIKIENLDAIVKNKFKKVTLKLENRSEFKIVGGSVKEIEGSTLKLIYNGEIKPLIEQLNTVDLQDLLIEEPSLEEIFINYYEKEGEKS